MSDSGASAGREPPHQERIAGARATGEAAVPPRPAAEHLVQFYEDDEKLSADVGRFLADGLEAADAVVAITTAAHRAAFEERLADLGVDVSGAARTGRVTFLDAHETLSALMRDGSPDRGLFEAVVGGLVAAKAGGLAAPARVRAYGEMIDVLWRAGQRAAAIHLEELWNDLQARHPSTLLCAHAIASFYKQPAELQTASSAPPHVVGGNGAAAEPPVPSHDARRLEQEISRRMEMENGLRAALRELRAKEEQLRQNEEQLRDFVENGTLGLHRVGPDGTILWANRAELELLGFEEHEYVGRNIADFHADAPVISDILARLTRGESLHDHEARLHARDGSIKHVLISSNVYARDGRFIHTRCFTRDITERRRAEEELRESHRQLQLITDALPVLVAFIDAEQKYQFASAGYERWFGHPRSEVVGRHIRDVLGVDAYRAVEPHVARALSGERVTFDAEVAYRDGGPRWIEATYIPRRDAAERVVGYVGLISDVTERKSFERFRAAAAARAERLLKITEALAGGIFAEEVFEALVDRVSDAIGASSSGLWLVDDEGRVARLVRFRGYSEAARRRLQSLPLDLSPSLPVIDCIRASEPVWIPSQAAMFDRYPHVQAVATPGRSYRVACLPLVANRGVLGALSLTIEEAREGSPEEREFLLLVASYASQAIVRLRLLDAERTSRADAHAAAARLGVLSHASRAFAESGLELGARLREVAS